MYAVTETFRKLLIAERFGQPPGWVDSLSPGELALSLAFDEVRRGQEAREMAARVKL